MFQYEKTPTESSDGEGAVCSSPTESSDGEGAVCSLCIGFFSVFVARAAVSGRYSGTDSSEVHGWVCASKHEHCLRQCQWRRDQKVWLHCIWSLSFCRTSELTKMQIGLGMLKSWKPRFSARCTHLQISHFKELFVSKLKHACPIEAGSM